MKEDLAEGIKCVAKALNKHGVEYMFVGWYQATNDNFIKLISGISDISPELKNELEKIVFDPKKTFIKFNLDKFHFDFLPELVAFITRISKGVLQVEKLGKLMVLNSMSFQKLTCS
jgi:hypothetical protein